VLDLEAGSFRDPDSTVFYADGRVLRGLTRQGAEDWRALGKTQFFERSTGAGKVVSTTAVAPEEARAHHQDWSVVLEHQAVPFISYPFEWTFGMLQDAAKLHLELLIDALGEQLSMKDGSAYNVQWWGTRPVFIDVSSFATGVDGPWAGYRQFCESFLNPLFLQALCGVDFHAWLRGRLDGIPVSDMRRLLRPRHLLRRGVLAHVVAHDLMQRAAKRPSQETKAALQQAGFDARLARRSAEQLLGVVDGLGWPARPSPWSDYSDTCSYSSREREQKAAFVREAARSAGRGMVWDLGCNDGTYARLAGAHADYVVAVDADHSTVDRLYRSLRQEGNERILPLVMNLADPTPGLGWRGSERRRLEDRGRPDLVLCLALVHHLALGANVPLEEVVAWLGSLGAPLVVEFADRADPMVRRMLADKPLPGRTYSTEHFETCLEGETRVRERIMLESGTRTLYYAVPR
jgi:hypothetical protein